MSEKIQKIISASGLMSRRKAEELIAAGKVTVNGDVCNTGDRADAENDVICVNGTPIPKKEQHCYIMLNKPAGYVTTLSDEKGRNDITVLLSGLNVRVYPVGRLDMFSEGLIILTDDGDFANRLMHPSKGAEKHYVTDVAGMNIAESVKQLKNIREVDDKPIRPARVKTLEVNGGSAQLEIIIHEGRNRQIRKMCEAAGLKVRRLVRVKEGELELGDLPVGKWRRLTESEITAVKGAVSENEQ